MSGEPSDEARRIRSGDPELLARLVREHTPSVLGWVHSWGDGPDEADDLVQEVWRRALSRKSSYRGTGSFRGWLYQVARSTCLDRAREASSRRAGAESLRRERAAGRAADTGDPVERLEAERRHRVARQAVNALPPRQGQVVRLRILQGLSVREAAAAMECAEGTVKASLSHALDNLRAALREDAEEELP